MRLPSIQVLSTGGQAAHGPIRVQAAPACASSEASEAAGGHSRDTPPRGLEAVPGTKPYDGGRGVDDAAPGEGAPDIVREPADGRGTPSASYRSNLRDRGAAASVSASWARVRMAAQTAGLAQRIHIGNGGRGNDAAASVIAAWGARVPLARARPL